MDATTAEMIRQIVDEIGWAGLRERHPELHEVILKQRAADRAWLDAELRYY